MKNIISRARIVTFCADIGSIRTNRFAWACSEDDLASRTTKDVNHKSPLDLANAVAAQWKKNRPIALGFECPLWVPVPKSAKDEKILGAARKDEGDRAWSAGGGAYSLTTGLVQVAWIMARLHETIPQAKFTTNPEKLGPGGILIWEAFVTGKAKGSSKAKDSHHKDAKRAVSAFQKQWPFPRGSAVTCTDDQQPYSLISTAIQFAGFKSGPSLNEACLVVKP